MSNNAIQSLAKKFLDVDANGYLFWFDNMDEQEMPKARIETLKKFVQEFQSKERPLINMYGGYLSILMSKYGLTGVIHGIAYWEKKQSKPISGGAAPPAKFYMGPIHERINPAELVLLVNECKYTSKKDFLDNICKCDTCTELITESIQESFITTYGESQIKVSKGRLISQATEKARILCRKHYLRAKAQEVNYVVGAEVAEIKRQLTAAKTTFEDKIDSIDLGYLDSWASILI